MLISFVPPSKLTIKHFAHKYATYSILLLKNQKITRYKTSLVIYQQEDLKEIPEQQVSQKKTKKLLSVLSDYLAI